LETIGTAVSFSNHSNMKFHLLLYNIVIMIILYLRLGGKVFLRRGYTVSKLFKI